jgi:hypothetical protein
MTVLGHQDAKGVFVLLSAVRRLPDFERPESQGKTGSIAKSPLVVLINLRAGKPLNQSVGSYPRHNRSLGLPDEAIKQQPMVNICQARWSGTAIGKLTLSSERRKPNNE